MQLQVLRGGQVAVERRVLEHEPDVAPDVVALGDDVVARRRSPSPTVGLASVHSMLIVVVLPAPFGPRNPNTSPVATSKSTPRTAWTSPNLLIECADA